jgi:hypothetical protein
MVVSWVDGEEGARLRTKEDAAGLSLPFTDQAIGSMPLQQMSAHGQAYNRYARHLNLNVLKVASWLRCPELLGQPNWLPAASAYLPRGVMPFGGSAA